MSNSLQAQRDAVWAELGSSPVRRFMLGRARCDDLVRLARNNLPETEMAAAPQGGRVAKMLAAYTERRVRDQYSEPCGLTFTTLVLSWAISAIVQALIKRWWNSRGGAT